MTIVIFHLCGDGGGRGGSWSGMDFLLIFFSTLMASHTVTCRNIQHSSALLLWRQAPYSAPSAPHSGRGLAAGTRWS